jgi:hypothetical protein
MRTNRSFIHSRRGITVLTLLLLIIAVIVAAFFLFRYLGTRPVPVQTSDASVYFISRFMS